jgi:hypothetical protein
MPAVSRRRWRLGRQRYKLSTWSPGSKGYWSLWLRNLEDNSLTRVGLLFSDGPFWIWSAYSIRGRRLGFGFGLDHTEMRSQATETVQKWLLQKHS